MNNIMKTMDILKEFKGYVEAYTDIGECAIALFDDCSIMVGNKKHYVELDARAFNSIEEMVVYTIEYFRSKED